MLAYGAKLPAGLKRGGVYVYTSQLVEALSLDNFSIWHVSCL